MSAMMDERQQRTSSPDKRRRDFGIIGRSLDRGAADFVSRLPAARGKRLLDVGCGTGSVSVAASRRGYDVTGVDPREPYLSRGRAWAKNEDLLIRFKPADAEKLPFSDGNFHVVVSFNDLFMTNEPATAAAEMRRVCRKGGVLAVAVWDAHSLVADMLRAAYRYSGDDRLTRMLDLMEEGAMESLFSRDVTPRRTEARQLTLSFDLAPVEVAACYLDFHAPLKQAADLLEAEARDALRDELAGLWAEARRDGGEGTRAVVPYRELEYARR